MDRYTSLLFGAALVVSNACAQQVITTAGSSATAGGVRVDQTFGEPMTATLQGGGVILTQGFQQPVPLRVKINIKAFLQGSYNTTTGRMNDGLRTTGLIPLNEPYTSLGYTSVGSGSGSTLPTVLEPGGPNAIIDWILVELRSASDPVVVSATRFALLQADGDIVDTDGSSAVLFTAPPGPYHIAVIHRNHLGVMSANAFSLSGTPISIDLTTGSTPTYGTDALADMNGVKVLWRGDVNGDGVLKYTGANNDRDPILVAIGGTVPTNVVSGYRLTDVNMDGLTKYTGTNNDRDPILVNIGGTVPTNVRHAQLP